ncbi:PREDICTED: uncharacterized protein LOC101366116 [Odobenus rosmarus divergens]|uniref:Uncharacterized protein LOC101366116 n=1 Tax=Odobenus rosmarus divergens TaxID=9708 RepID=A0A9B0GV38_ODORO
MLLRPEALSPFLKEKSNVAPSLGGLRLYLPPTMWLAKPWSWPSAAAAVKALAIPSSIRSTAVSLHEYPSIVIWEKGPVSSSEASGFPALPVDQIGKSAYFWSSVLGSSRAHKSAAEETPVLTVANEKPKEGVNTENNDHINLKVVGQDGSMVQFKIKRHTPLSKLMKAYCERQGLSMRQIRFQFDGQPINETDTPAHLEMEDEDTIDMLQQQTGDV